LLGDPGRAYAIISNVLNSTKVAPQFNQLFSRKLDPNSKDTYDPFDQLYRMRPMKDWDINKGAPPKLELFHPPFDKRHVISTQRYSIPGFPCLYLGGSLSICWKEFNCPDFSNLYISRFRIKPSNSGKKVTIKLLDLGWRPSTWAACIDYYANKEMPRLLLDFIVANALCWPLIAACSIRVKKAEAPFKPEYIVPQILLQWIMREKPDIDGIRCFSIKEIKYAGNIKDDENYVFPTRVIKESGYCSRLKGLFVMTDPVSVQELMLQGGQRALDNYQLKDIDEDD
jgi:hypothetical protein